MTNILVTFCMEPWSVIEQKIIIRESFLSLPSKKVERKSKLKAGQVRIVNILITFLMELRSVIGKKANSFKIYFAFLKNAK